MIFELAEFSVMVLFIDVVVASVLTVSWVFAFVTCIVAFAIAWSLTPGVEVSTTIPKIVKIANIEFIIST